MALQQLSSGGASRPVTPLDATSQAAQQQSQQQNSSGGFNLQQYNSDIANIPTPVVSPGQPGVTAGASGPVDFSPPAPAAPVSNIPGASVSPSTPTPVVPDTPQSPDIQIDPYTSSDLSNTDPNGLLGSTRAPGNPYEWDPFSFGGAGEGAALTSETQSPGYQQSGQAWLDLLNTISTQNLKWGGTNDSGGELKGGGTVGPWLSQNIVSPWNSGNQQQAYAGALDFISSQTGKPPQDPETQQLAGAFLEYTLQNNARYGANTQNFANRKANDGGKGILGIVEDVGEAVASIVQPELAPAFAALNLAQGAAEGNLSPLSALSDVAGAFGGGFEDLGELDPELSNAFGFTETASDFGPSLAGDASLLQDFSNAGQVFNAIGDAAGVAGALSNGSPLGAIGPAINLGGIADSFSSGTSSGTTGSNSTVSSDISSSLANTLGVSQQDFSQGLDDLMAAGSLGSAAIPLVQNLTSSSPTLNIQPQPAAPAPTDTTVAATTASSAPGQALTPQQVLNPSQAGYQAPGPRQANPTINPQLASQILQALGIAA